MKTNLAQHINPSNLTDFLPGDVVVFISENSTEQLLTVFKVEQDSILLESDSKFASSHLIRHATVAEIKAKRRLTEAEHSIAEVP